MIVDMTTYSAGTTYKVWVNNQEIGLVRKGEREVVRVAGGKS